jgi:hypothetical protein
MSAGDTLGIWVVQSIHDVQPVSFGILCCCVQGMWRLWTPPLPDKQQMLPQPQQQNRTSKTRQMVGQSGLLVSSGYGRCW